MKTPKVSKTVKQALDKIQACAEGKAKNVILTRKELKALGTYIAKCGHFQFEEAVKQQRSIMFSVMFQAKMLFGANRFALAA